MINLFTMIFLLPKISLWSPVSKRNTFNSRFVSLNCGCLNTFHSQIGTTGNFAGTSREGLFLGAQTGVNMAWLLEVLKHKEVYIHQKKCIAIALGAGLGVIKYNIMSNVKVLVFTSFWIVVEERTVHFWPSSGGGGQQLDIVSAMSVHVQWPRAGRLCSLLRLLSTTSLPWAMVDSLASCQKHCHVKMVGQNFTKVNKLKI